MSGVYWTHGFWFLTLVRRCNKIPSWTKSELYANLPLFVLAGIFYGMGGRTTTSSAIYSISAASMHSSKGPSPKNRFLSLSVVHLHHLSRAYSTIRASPLWKSWWVKMVHPNYFWYFSSFHCREQPHFEPLPLSIFIYFFLMCSEGRMVRINTTTTAPLFITSLLWVLLFASQKHCVLAAHNQTITLPCYPPWKFKGILLQYLPNII